MTARARRVRTLATTAAAAVLVAATVVLGSAADAAPSDAARLVREMRSAAGDHDFTATARVIWRDVSGARKTATVGVRAIDGSLVFSSAGQVVFDERGDTFVSDESGWWAPARQPQAGGRPAPDARWALALERGTHAGRPTTTVVASRADGSTAQRLVIDDATKVLVARRVVGRDGRLERGFRFTSFSVGPAAISARSVAASPTASGRDARAIRHVPDQFDAPGVIGAGYRLVSKSRHGDGVQLGYSDGLFTLSVLEQPGELDWGALPDAGTATTVDGARARRYAQPLGEVLVWERDGVVFTCVSDAPRDVSMAAVEGISAGPGVVDRVVDFVLAPFSFD